MNDCDHCFFKVYAEVKNVTTIRRSVSVAVILIAFEIYLLVQLLSDSLYATLENSICAHLQLQPAN